MDNNKKAQDKFEGKDPDRPFDLPFTIEETIESIKITKRGGTGREAIFVSVWMVGWTGGCLFLSLQGYLDPNPFTIALTLCFWAFWIAVGSGFIWILFGSETVTLDVNGCRHIRRAPFRIASREIQAKQMVAFREYQTEDIDGDPHFGIELLTTGKPLRFFYDTEDEAHREWLTGYLNTFCGLANMNPLD